MKRISSADAASEYSRRHGRRWFDDAWVGLLLTTTVETCRRAFLRLDQARRAQAGLRLRKSVGPVPEWLRLGLETFRPWLAAHPTGPASVWIGWTPLEQLLAFIDGGAPLPDVSSLNAVLVADVAKRIHSPRANDSLQAFRLGVKMVAASRGRAAKPSQVALLAGACGMETFSHLARARKLWEDRDRAARKRTPVLSTMRARFVNVDATALDAIAPVWS